MLVTLEDNEIHRRSLSKSLTVYPNQSTEESGNDSNGVSPIQAYSSLYTSMEQSINTA